MAAIVYVPLCIRKCIAAIWLLRNVHMGYSFKIKGCGGPRRRTPNEFKFWESYYFYIWHILRLGTLNLGDKRGGIGHMNLHGQAD